MRWSSGSGGSSPDTGRGPHKKGSSPQQLEVNPHVAAEAPGGPGAWGVAVAGGSASPVFRLMVLELKCLNDDAGELEPRRGTTSAL